MPTLEEDMREILTKQDLLIRLYVREARGLDARGMLTVMRVLSHAMKDVVHVLAHESPTGPPDDVDAAFQEMVGAVKKLGVTLINTVHEEVPTVRH